MKEGDIVVFKRNGKSGYVGIVFKGGKFISVGFKKVFEMFVDDFCKNLEDIIVNIVVWRIKKKLWNYYILKYLWKINKIFIFVGMNFFFFYVYVCVWI